VSFQNGQLVIDADNANTGIVITDDPARPGTRAGRGFSHTFGLNDLVSHGGPLSYATGLSAADDHGFTGGDVTFALRDNDGAIVRTVSMTVTAGTTMGALRTELNTALQGFGTATLDANGRMTLTPTNNNIGRIDVLQDTTVRGDTALSVSQLFGFGESLPIERARSNTIRSDIRANPNLLGSAQADLAGAAAGQRVLSPGDGRGALALEAAGTTPRAFSDAGSLTGQVTSISDYAARLAGHAGVRAEALEAAKAAAESVREEVRERRMSEEGVNLDEELVKMTTYQQAYAAASRMIQAARDLYDIVLNMV
jgi:flagellar hook-associated protein 1 FlgK